MTKELSKELPKELQDIRASTEQLIKQYKEIKGFDEKDSLNMECVERMFYEFASYINRRLNMVEDNFYNWIFKHEHGHLPPANGAGKMEHALDVLGLSEDYEVKKPVIYASHSKHGLTVEAEYKKPSK